MTPEQLQELAVAVEAFEADPLGEGDWYGNTAVVLLQGRVKELQGKFERMIMAEYSYWRQSDCEGSVSAMGALSNVLSALYGHKPTHHKPEMQ